MEEQKCMEMKNSDNESSKITSAEKEKSETKTAKNAISETKSTNNENFEMGVRKKTPSKASDNSMNSSSVVKDRGKIECDQKSEAFCKIPITPNTQAFRETAKYRDGESYAQQHHHSIGTGLYLTDEIEDLPPRFRNKVLRVLENALAFYNIKLDRNPLEYFVSYSDNSKEPDSSQDKLVYVPPNVQEDKPETFGKKSCSVPPSKSNFIPKKSSELEHQRSNHDSLSNTLERNKSPFSSASSRPQVASQTLRKKTDTKPPLPRTYWDDDYSVKQKNKRGKSVPQLDVQKRQSQKLNPHRTNAYGETFSLPSNSFEYCSKCPPRDKSVLKKISDAVTSNVDAKTLFGMLSQLSCENCNADFKELLDEITFYQDKFNPELPPSDVVFSCDYRYTDDDNENEAKFERKHEQFQSYKKSSRNTNDPTTENYTRISVDEIFPNLKSGCNTSMSERADSHLGSPSQYKTLNRHATVPCNDVRVNTNTKTYSKNKTFTNSNKQFKYSHEQNTSFNENKNPFKSQHKYSASDQSATTRHCDTISPVSDDYKCNENEKNNLRKTHNQENGKHFAKPSDKPFEKNKGKKFSQNSKLSSRDQETPQDLSLKHKAAQNKYRKHSDSCSSSQSSKSYDRASQHNDTPSNLQDNFRNPVNTNRNSFKSFSHEKSMYKQRDEKTDFNQLKNYSRHKDKYSDSSSVVSDQSATTRNCDTISSVSDNYNFNKNEKNSLHKMHSQKTSKHFAKPSEKPFDQNKGKKFFQNSKLSPRDQEITERKHSSYSSAEDLHHSSRTDLTQRKSSNNKEYHKYRSTDNEKNDIPSNLQDNFRNPVNTNRNSFKSFSREKSMCKQLDEKTDFNRLKNYSHHKDKFSDSSSVLSDQSATRSNSDNISSVSDNYNFNQNEKNSLYKTHSQKNGKHFTNRSDKSFDENKGKKFFQNSKLSPRDQEITERKHSSYSSAEDLHHSSRTDFTHKKSSYDKEYHKSRSTDIEMKRERNSRVCTSIGFFVKVEVSDEAEDIEKWMKCFQHIFSFPFDFERCCHFSNIFILEFERKEQAFTAIDLLYRERKILQKEKKPHFLQISTLLYRLTKPCSCKENVIHDCVRNIKKHFDSALCVVNGKKNEIFDSKSTFKMSEPRKAAETKILKSFEESISNFTHFKENTISDVKQAEELREVQHHRHSFIRECNIFKRCLPIYSKKAEIVQLARGHSVSVIVAETGSGKSTQIVEYLLHSPLSENGRIICTQPRKLAAISIAQFVSGQVGSAIGKIVGYDVGIEKKYSDDTKIIYMTDYCLLKYFLKHRDLKGISCIIIDEAHERSLYTDLIFGLLKKCLDVRRDLSVLITSATINPTIFVDYFNMPENCVIDIPGRTYPVDVHWYPEDVEMGWDYLDACVRQAYEIHVKEKEGDILVFLTSPSESDEAIYLFNKRLQSKKIPKPQLLSLHGKSDIQDQMLIFQKTSKSSRKIIFATNVAETAVTIPGIKYVVDSGMTKELMFDPQKNKSYLAVTFINKSAAEQRKGRAGRIQSGVCYRMYSERNYAENMTENAEPEIFKSNLQKALLKIFEFGIDPEKFDFIEAPPARTISNSVESLEYLGAIENKRLTDLGKKLVKLPLEPQLSKLVLQGIEAKIGIETIIIAALVSESGKLFIRNEDNKVEANERKKKFCQEGGDLCTFLEIYKRWKDVDPPERYEWCVVNFISYKALTAAAKTVKEILITLRTDLGLHVLSRYNTNDFKKQYEKIIFDSFSENLCVLSGHPKLGYLSPYFSESFFIHPSSTISFLGKDSPEFLVYSTLMETSRNFLFDITPISEATLKTAYQAGKFRLPLHTLRSLQVPPKIMGPFGESLLIRHILGKKGTKIRDLEKSLTQLTSVKDLYIDVDVTKGLITVYLSQRLHEKAKNHIQQIINVALNDMLEEEDIVKVSGTSVYFALCAGGIVNDVILPGEFRELIFNRVQSKDQNELENILKTFGPLQSLSPVSSKQDVQICATFKKVEHAKKAVMCLKEGKKYVVSPKPYLSNVSYTTSPLHLLSISWCCRPCIGYGVVELYSEEDLIEASGTLTCNSFFVGNNLIMFQVASDPRTLCMKNLPEYVEENTIKEKLKESLPSHIKIKFIKIHRKNVRITEATVEEAKKKLSKFLSYYVSSSKFTIDLKCPGKEASWNAAVYFEKAADAESTFMKLNDNACIDSYPLSLRQIFKSQLFCGRDVFDKFSVQVNNILRERKAEGICNDFSIKRVDGQFGILVEFSCVNLENLYKTRISLSTFLRGEHLELIGNSKYHFLFTEGLSKQIKKIEKSTNTFIKLQVIKKVISIYGSARGCQKAKNEIHCLALNPDISFTRTFNLKNSCIPYGFLKHLYSEYGYDLHGLASEFQLTVASIDNNASTLTLKGSKDRIKKAEQALEKLCENLFNSKGKRQKKSSDEEECPICLDPVSYDFQRLEHCGHAFCRKCLLLQIESKSMPVVCVKQDCGKLIFLEDIRRIVSIGGDELKKSFRDIALQYHVSCNIGKLSYCHTPDCQMVYRVTKEGSEYNCPSCKNSTCTKCQTPYHYGMSCEMYQECQKNEDYSLEMWVKEDESSRKCCPSCKVVIEKAEGCNHMECLNCKSHLCWLCMEVFANGDDVYNHLPYCPKNQ